MDRRMVSLAVTAGVAVFAAANSYNHVYTVARNYGQDELSAALLWFSVDGLILVGALSLGRHWAAHIALWAGVAATVGANVACGLGHGPIGAVVSAWPAGAFLLCAEIALAKSAPEPAPEGAPEKQSESAPESALALRRRAEPRAVALAMTDAPDVLAELRREAAAGALPPKREIKARARVGWDKAVLIHEELSALVPA
jgi:hypothetical protein